MMCFRGIQVVDQLHDMYWIEDVSLDYSNKFADGFWIIKVRIRDSIVGVNVPAWQNGKDRFNQNNIDINSAADKIKKLVSVFWAGFYQISSPVVSFIPL